MRVSGARTCVCVCVSRQVGRERGRWVGRAGRGLSKRWAGVEGSVRLSHA